MKSVSISIVIAGGGTGGHLSPGIAIAQEFKRRDGYNRILFIGTDRPLEIDMLARAGFAHRSITAEGFKSRSVSRQMVSLAKVPKGIFEAWGMLREARVDLVIGVGSFSAGPVVLSARLMGIPCVLHEQNLVPGMTNRLLAPFAERIYVSFDETKTFFNTKKTLLSGNPVRAEFVSHKQANGKQDDSTNEGTRPFTIIITGGSQGAHRLNEMVMDGLKFITAKDNLFFIHQAGTDDENKVRDAYREYGISCRVQSFFQDGATQYRNADLIICRAGATTVAEITALGKGALFIPFPFHSDQHQVKNAQLLKDAGAADMILEEDLSGEGLMDRIKYYASNRNVLDGMAKKAESLGERDAAAAIVDDCYRLLERIGSA